MMALMYPTQATKNFNKYKLSLKFLFFKFNSIQKILLHQIKNKHKIT